MVKVFCRMWWRSKKKIYRVNQHPINSGEPCKPSDGQKETEVVILKNRLAEDCEGSWGQWSPCSKTCGGGSQERTFNITKEAQGSEVVVKQVILKKHVIVMNKPVLFLVLVILANMVIVS